MKIIKPSSEYLDRNIHPYKLIERIGRTCYKSEDKITEDSAARFVKAMATHRHFAMLEHGEIYLKISGVALIALYKDYENALALRYITAVPELFFDEDGKTFALLSGSFRAFLEMCETFKTLYSETRFQDLSDVRLVIQINNYLSEIYPEVFTKVETEYSIQESPFINFMTEKDAIRATKNSKYFAKEDDRDDCLSTIVKHSVKFVCDRGVSHEFVRHRPCSFAQESTRYCNYSKEQFGNEITVIEPFYYADDRAEEYDIWKQSCEFAEKAYLKLLEHGTPQEARAVLPNSLKTELIITANEKEWQHILDLRYHGVTGKPHPQMYEAMDTIYETLLEKSEHRLH